MSSSRWNESFPPKNTDLDKHPQLRVPLWISRRPVKKFQHNTSEPGLLEEDKRNSFTLLLPSSPKVAHLGAQKDSPGLWFHPQGE